MSKAVSPFSPCRLMAAGLWLGVAACALVATSAWAAGNRLQAVDAVAAGDNRVNIVLTLADSAPEPSVFTVNDPARLSIDLPDTDLGVEQNYRRIDNGAVQAVALASGSRRTRVVVELARMVNYDISRRGNEIVVGLGGPQTHTPPAAATTSPAATRARKPRAPGGGAALRNIDFRRGENGAGRLEISLVGVNSPVEVSNAGGRVVARLPGVRLPERLRKRLDVRDFATPVNTIDAMMRDGSTRIVINPVSGAEYEQVAYQTGSDFIIELQPLTESERARQQQKPQYTGERISLSFQDIDVRAVLQIIADVADVNMVVSDSVTGDMALRLEEVPWDQALDIIMQAKGLGMRRENNVISVAPLTEITAREKDELRARQATQSLAPLRSEIIQINYASAADIARLLESNSAPAASSGTESPAAPISSKVSLLSRRGRVTVDERTNSLLINETREKLDEIRRLINRLDIPVRQVLIESRIVVANREFQRNLGVTAVENDTGAFESPSGGNYIADSGFSIALPADQATSVLSTSILGDTFALDLKLSAMESENEGEIISSPRVITASGQEANIEQGREIPYQEGGTGGLQTATISFKKAVLSLTVTPQITPDGRVIMSLNITQDSQGENVSVQGGGSVPAIDTRSLTTHILVDDGETVVLGGIYEQENRDQADRVPILGEIPIFGTLFRGTQRQRDKRELLLFVTPKILRDSLTTR